MGISNAGCGGASRETPRAALGVYERGGGTRDGRSGRPEAEVVGLARADLRGANRVFLGAVGQRDPLDQRGSRAEGGLGRAAVAADDEIGCIPGVLQVEDTIPCGRIRVAAG